MKYEPNDPASRRELTHRLVTKLAECGFSEEEPNPEKCKERVFSRNVILGLRILVYTSIDLGGTTRRNGKDSIRICAVYTARDNRERGVASTKRVHRVGKIGDIVDRMHQRMRDVWKLASTAERCHCGAPKCTSKKGKLFCADLCWKTLSELQTDNRRHDQKMARQQQENDYWRRKNQGRRSTGYQSAVPAGDRLPDSWKDAPLAKQVAFGMAAGDTSGVDWDSWADNIMEQN